MTTAERLRVLAAFLEEHADLLPDEVLWPSCGGGDDPSVHLFRHQPADATELAGLVRTVAAAHGTTLNMRPLKDSSDVVHETHVPYRGTTIHLWTAVPAADTAPAAVHDTHVAVA